MKSILSLSAAFVLAAAMAGCSTNGSMKTGENGECCADGAKGACCAEGKAEGKADCSATCADKKAEPSASAAGAVNAKCPYSGNPVNMSVTSDYKGRTVAFCCGGCSTKWNKEIDADRDAMLSKVMAK